MHADCPIHRLSGDSARLLLVLLSCTGQEQLQDLPTLITKAGLDEVQNNTHGKNRYARAYRQLHDLGFLSDQDGTLYLLWSPWRETVGEGDTAC